MLQGKVGSKMWPLLPSHHIRFPAHRPVIGFSAPTGSPLFPLITTPSPFWGHYCADRPRDRELSPPGFQMLVKGIGATLATSRTLVTGCIQAWGRLEECYREKLERMEARDPAGVGSELPRLRADKIWAPPAPHNQGDLQESSRGSHRACCRLDFYRNVPGPVQSGYCLSAWLAISCWRSPGFVDTLELSAMLGERSPRGEDPPAISAGVPRRRGAAGAVV
jgi:hypothetical protein